MLVPLLALLLQAAPAPAAPPEPPPAARVVAAVAAAARENAALPGEKRLAGDALADRLVARAAAAGTDADAFLLGLAHALDPGETLARHPLTAAAVKGLETAEAAKARREALGKPTLRGRGDLLLHFALSAAAAALAGPAPAEAAGVAKEIADARPGGSGFSFRDLLADVAGIRFAAWVKADPKERLARLAREFRGEAFCPDPSGEPEGLDAEAFAKAWGGPADDRFRRKVAALKEAIAALPVHAPPAKAGAR
jgi:hypothetical protein